MGVDDSDLTTQQNQAYQIVQVQVRQTMSLCLSDGRAWCVGSCGEDG